MNEHARAGVVTFLRGLTYLFWFFIIVGLIAAAILMTSLVKGWFGSEPLPTFQQLENPESKLASDIYSADGSILGKFFVENRSNVSYQQIPRHFTEALIATEDRRFHDHSGIDYYGLMSAMYRTLIKGQQSGASTITQQLAKNLFHDRSSHIVKRIIQKLKEWIIALRLERSYTKSEILTMYLNTVPFSNNSHGIKAAAKTYFNKEPEDLNVQESAVLVGMLKASTRYSPTRNPESSRGRRNEVLSQMAKYGYINASDRDSLIQTPLVVDPISEDHNEGLATYFREFVKLEAKKWAKNNKKLDGTSYDIFRDGLKIYTTIDSRMQQYAEEAVDTHMRKLQKDFFAHWNTKKAKPWDDMPELLERAMQRSERYRVGKKVLKWSEEEILADFNKPVKMKVFDWERGEIDTTMTPLDSIAHRKMYLNTGIMAMDTRGDVKAWVGGINHKYFKYDNVAPHHKRQVGSTFKPFVYTVAIQNGWSPCMKLPNVAITFIPGTDPVQEAWTPKNSGSKYNGDIMTLKFALAKSINRITARLIREVGPKPVVELVERMGIEKGTVPPYPSICLGTPDISLFEMVGAYGTFMNKGVYTKPRYITRIEDKNGREIADFTHERKEVLSETDAYIMLNLLQGVTDLGTGARLRFKYGFEGEIAGKTGTTDDHSDGWYMGVTPQLVAGVWTGGDEKKIHFEDLALGSGSNMALPIWAEFMKRVHANKELNIDPYATFERPKVPLPVELDCSKYDLLEQLDQIKQDANYYEQEEEEQDEFLGF